MVGPTDVLFDELSSSDLAHLLSLSHKTIDLCLNSLHFVLNVPKTPSKPLQLLHPSFRGFLLDENRCVDRRFFREKSEIHENLFFGCLEVMSSSLTRNICLLPTPGSPPHSISQAVLSKKLPKHLRYACQYWAEHLRHLKPIFASKYLHAITLERFFKENFLNWIEFMSLLGRLTQAVLMVTSILNLIQDCNFVLEAQKQRLGSLVGDAYRFIQSYRSVIEIAPLQVYASALVFSPVHSLMRQIYTREMPTWLRSSLVRHGRWDKCLLTLESSGDTISSLAVSDDNNYLACGMSHGPSKYGIQRPAPYKVRYRIARVVSCLWHFHERMCLHRLTRLLISNSLIQ